MHIWDTNSMRAKGSHYLVYQLDSKTTTCYPPLSMSCKHLIAEPHSLLPWSTGQCHQVWLLPLPPLMFLGGNPPGGRCARSLLCQWCWCTGQQTRPWHPPGWGDHLPCRNSNPCRCTSQECLTSTRKGVQWDGHTWGVLGGWFGACLQHQGFWQGGLTHWYIPNNSASRSWSLGDVHPANLCASRGCRANGNNLYVYGG